MSGTAWQGDKIQIGDFSSSSNKTLLFFPQRILTGHLKVQDISEEPAYARRHARPRKIALFAVQMGKAFLKMHGNRIINFRPDTGII